MQEENNYHINPNFIAKKKQDLQLNELIDGVTNGDRYKLSDAITLIESEDLQKKTLASNLLIALQQKQNKTDNALRIAITGSPGAGKSTFIDYFGTFLANLGHKIAVLAIDPSSDTNKGSILGDKTRMTQLSNHPNVFIRPSSAGGSLGGVAKHTYEAALLCSTAGYDLVLIETVGVGQSEYLASKMVDLTIVLLQPGAGDDLQGIKRGLMEVVDIIAVTKADGAQKDMATKTSKDYQSIINLHQDKTHGWKTKIAITSAFDHVGFDKMYDLINQYRTHITANGWLTKNRIDQSIFWYEACIRDALYDRIMDHTYIREKFELLKSKILNEDEPALECSHQFLKFLDHLLLNQ